MKKLILVLSLMFLDSSLGAQVYSTMNQEQLNLALEKAESSIRAGRKLTIIGAVVGVAGFTAFIVDSRDTGKDVGLSFSSTLAEILVTAAGLGMMGAGIPKWILGKNKKDKIEIELVKLKSPGMESINGVGIKIRF